jgi:SAM-dependent methyltransferase
VNAAAAGRCGGKSVLGASGESGTLTAVSHPAVEQFFTELRASLAEGRFVRLNLGVPTQRDGARNVFIRPVLIKGTASLSFVYRHPTRDLTRNFPPDEGVSLLAELLGNEFLNGFLSTTTGTLQLTHRKGRSPRLVVGKAEVTSPPDMRHDRPKNRAVAQNASWLRGLGVTNPDDSVRPGMEAKFRQIHRFIELLDPLLEDAPLQAGEPLHLVDMGCGKGYLTFAAYEHLKRTRPAATVTGIEARAELVRLGNQVAEDCGFDGLRFDAGEIRSVALPRVDVLVALHACDTATDDALAKGISAGASLIVVSPCCHQEIRPSMVAPPVLAGALRHGIFRERQAEFVTDALRAGLLEWAGYDTRVFEFISPEHTGKNLMIAAVKRSQPFDRDVAARKVRELAAFYGLTQQCLAGRLNFDLAAGI